MGDQKMVAPRAIAHVLESLGIERISMSAAVAEMHALAETMDNPDGIKRALTYAYGNGEGSFSGENTRLLGMVWPYMKTLSVATQEAWLRLAIDEAYTAYGPNGGLSCSMGVQERLTTTGFLATLAGLDPRLVAISTLVQNVATTEVDPLIEGGVSSLSLEIQEEILSNNNPNKATIEGWIRASAKAYAENIEVFQAPAVLASGMTPAEDLWGHPEVERKMQERAVPLYTDTDYDKFDKWRGRVQRAYVMQNLESSRFLSIPLLREGLFESFSMRVQPRSVSDDADEILDRGHGW